MIKRFNITPQDTYRLAGNNKVLYTPVVAVKTSDHVHIYVSGRTSRNSSGELVGKGNMRAQIRTVCENIKISLEAAGALMTDVVKTVTYVTDMKAYFDTSDERLEFFPDPMPTSTTVCVNSLATAGMLVEIEAEAIIEPERFIEPTA